MVYPEHCFISVTIFGCHSASDDIPNVETVRRLLQAIRDIRLAKTNQALLKGDISAYRIFKVVIGGFKEDSLSVLAIQIVGI